MKPGVPDDIRIYAIGDIHGCDDLLVTLLKQIIANDSLAAPIETKMLIFLGDYIDRGPGSKKVIDILLNDLPDGYDALFLKGNHEAMLLDALEDKSAVKFWLYNGGLETITSYGGRNLSAIPDLNDDELIRFFDQRLSNEHRDFLNALITSHEVGDYYFAHAGVHPDRALDEQTERDLLWIRDRFLFSEKNFGKIIVHGHTPGKEVDEADNQIGIDTGAVYGGKLTALMLEGREKKFLYAQAKKGGEH